MNQVTRGLRLVLEPVLAALAAVLLGALVGVLLAMVLNALNTSGDDWSDLGNVIYGTLAAFLVAVVTWVVGLSRAARRLFSRGRRAPAVVLAVLGTLLVLVVLRVVEAGVAGTGLSTQGWGLGLLLTPLVASGVFVLWDRRAATSLAPRNGPSPVETTAPSEGTVR